MTEKERMDYLTVMVAKLIQLNVHEKQLTGRFGPPDIYQSFLDMQQSIMEHDCIKEYNATLKSAGGTK